MEAPVSEITYRYSDRDNHPEAKKEHKPKIYENSYHGANIKIIEFDHTWSEQGGIEYAVPGNWRDLLRQQIDSSPGPIVPEYCIPDLELNVYKQGDNLRKISTLIMPNVRRRGEVEGVTQFFSYIARVAGSEGRTLLAMDPANSLAYAFAEQSDYGRFKIPKDRQAGVSDGDLYFGKYGEIDPTEISHSYVVDSRRLFTARGLMQQSLKRKDLVHINAPRHAERVDNYIKRQIDWETQSGVRVEQPQDMQYVNPPEERGKMDEYSKRKYEKTIREYVPILTPQAYEIDLYFHDQNWDPSQLLTMVREYLSAPVSTEAEGKFRRNLMKAEKIISANIERGVFSNKQKKKVSALLDTNRTGWKLTRKDPIY